MWEKYLNFIRGVSVNNWGKAGVILTTSAFFTFILLELFRIGGILTNQYVGLVTYLLFPLLFIIGLIFIPIGWKQYKEQTGKSTQELLQRQFPDEELESGLTGSRLFLFILVFTGINVLFLAGISMRTLSFMDKSEFCGNACHSVMNPEWTTYQESPHARVPCVECHVGEGVGALIDSKLNGLYQMVSATFNLYEQPIPTPVHQLRPAQETCEHCHWPEKFYGSNLESYVTYKMDSLSTPQYTTLNLKVDGGPARGYGGIHWHIAEENQVRYTSVDDERRTMIWVEVLQPDGSYKRYENSNLNMEHYEEATVENSRIMDCVDCHNRATHIYENPADAIDERMRKGLLPKSLPYIKREAYGAITNNYNTVEAAMQGIENSMYGFYRRAYPDQFGGMIAEIDSAVKVLQDIWSRNVHPEMNITWGVYPSHRGHPNEQIGCYRCHNKFLIANNDLNDTISDDCTLCHSILADDSGEPFEYLRPVEDKQPLRDMIQYLQEEFMDYYIE